MSLRWAPWQKPKGPTRPPDNRPGKKSTPAPPDKPKPKD